MDGKKVLVAEDDPGVRFTVEFVLKDEGYQVFLAEDGQRALDLAVDQRPDLILLDNLMPRMDGPQVLRALRADERTASIPVLALTGTSQDEGEWDDETQFLQKPFAPSDLIEKVGSILGT